MNIHISYSAANKEAYNSFIVRTYWHFYKSAVSFAFILSVGRWRKEREGRMIQQLGGT